MAMRTMPFPASSGVALTLITSMRGSHRASASRDASSIKPSVLALIDSNISSQILQPNAGRITRSPGAVDSTTRMPRSMSSTPVDMAIDPVWSTRIGKAMPRPTYDGSMSKPLTALFPSSDPVPSVQLERHALDLGERLAGDAHRGTLRLQLTVGGDAHCLGALEVDREALDL